MSRKPTSNDPPKQKKVGVWDGGDELMDGVALLLNDLGKRCSVCKGVVRNEDITKRDGKVFCPYHAGELIHCPNPDHDDKNPSAVQCADGTVHCLKCGTVKQ